MPNRPNSTQPTPPSSLSKRLRAIARRDPKIGLVDRNRKTLVEAANALRDLGGGLGEEDRERFRTALIDEDVQLAVEHVRLAGSTEAIVETVEELLCAAFDFALSQSEDGSEGRVVVELSVEEAEALLPTGGQVDKECPRCGDGSPAHYCESYMRAQYRFHNHLRFALKKVEP